MSLSNFSEDLNIISKLPDAPTLTASQLKAKFDEGGLKIKDYINEQLLPDISEAFAAKEQRMEEALSNVRESLPEIADSLEDASENKALSANKGKELYSLITENSTDINDLKTLIANLTTAVNSKQNTITYGEGTPSGGVNGDIYLMY